MIGTNSSGARTVAYGGTKDHVLALEVVLADGSVFQASPVAEGGPEAGRAPGRGYPCRKVVRLHPASAPHRPRHDHRSGMPRVVKNCSGYRLEAHPGGTALLTCRSFSWEPRALSDW